MGHRMELYVIPEVADKIIKISRTFDVDARVIGCCEEFDGKRLSIYSDVGKFDY